MRWNPVYCWLGIQEAMIVHNRVDVGRCWVGYVERLPESLAENGHGELALSKGVLNLLNGESSGHC